MVAQIRIKSNLGGYGNSLRKRENHPCKHMPGTRPKRPLGKQKETFLMTIKLTISLYYSTIKTHTESL